MDNLLSGFIGALIATILTVVYLYIADKVRLRTEITLEIVGFCDDIYNHIQIMHNLKDVAYTQNINLNLLENDEYKSNSRKLATLQKSTKTMAKLEITYGEGKLVGNLNRLLDSFNNASSILRKSSQTNWHENNKQIHQMFEQRIDPLRNNLYNEMIQSTRISAIAIDFIKIVYRNVIILKNKINKKKT